MTSPASSDSLPQTSPHSESSHTGNSGVLEPPTMSDAEASTLPAPDPPRKRIAFLVIHGIGQQRPYQTLDQFGRGLLKSFEGDDRTPWKIFPQLNICKDPNHAQEDWVRASCRLTPDRSVPFISDMHKKGDTIEDISLFEYYWAPITQDKITYSGSLIFLIKAGLQPFLYMAANINAIGKTDPGRLMKVVLREFIRQALLFLPLILLLAAGLAWLNALNISELWKTFKSPAPTVIFTAILIFIRYLYTYTTANALWQSLTTKSGWQRSIFWRLPLFLLVLFNVFLWPVFISPVLNSIARFGSWIGTFGRWLPDHLGHWSNGLRTIAMHTAIPSADPVWHNALYSFVFLDPSFAQYFPTILWFVLAAFVRSILINYVGDVAVYVNASELAKNFAARAQILDECTAALNGLLKQVIDSKNPDSARAYDQVYVAAHSLGSVIAYDTINLLLDRARTADPNPNQVHASDLQRLRGMVTFGSPLNKIYYFFREQTDPRAALRSQTLDLLNGFRVLPGLMQSIDTDMKFQPVTNQDWLDAEHYLDRGFRWINAYSIEDPISGRLIFFDLEDVQNQQEYNLYPPLLAHLSYWKDASFYSFIRERLL